METVLDALSEGVLFVDETCTVTSANAAARDLLDCDEQAGRDVRELLPRSVEATFHRSLSEQPLTPESLSFEEYFPQLDRWLRVRTEPLTDDTARVLVVVLQDVSARNRDEQRLREQSRELWTVTRIIAIVESVVERLTRASERDAVERYVCEQLVTADLYSSAWIGAHDLTTGALERRTVAGATGEDLVEEILDSAGEATEALEHRAIGTGEMQVVQSLAECETVPESVRRVAFARGFQSGIAVPLGYGETTYGVLGVYTDRTDAFDEGEQDAFAALGTAAGHAINAVKQERLLLSNTAVELTFKTTAREGFIPSAARELDTEIRIRGLVPLDGTELSVYIEFGAGAPRTVLNLATETTVVRSARVVRSYDSGGVVELVLAESTLLATLAAYGGTVRSGEFDPDGGRIVSEFAPSDDLADVVETITRRFDGVALVAKRELEADIETVEEFRNELRERLTDRQRTALQTSYLADYFESPRGSTAEEVADSLGISSSTFHHHLRAAQRKLLDSFFEEFVK